MPQTGIANRPYRGAEGPHSRQAAPLQGVVFPRGKRIFSAPISGSDAGPREADGRHFNVIAKIKARLGAAELAVGAGIETVPTGPLEPHGARAGWHERTGDRLPT